VRYPFLALLANGPVHGYELKQAVESALGAAWPEMNFGQIYTTLGRLERDGLVEAEEVAQNDRPNKRVYRLTEQGRKELAEWVDSPSPASQFKSQFFIKLVISRATGLADPESLIRQHRAQLLQEVKNLDRMGPAEVPAADPASRLLFEGARLHLKADLRWLDVCERELVSAGAGKEGLR
jgi:DNA-binding PadR family transcriptional regulator